MALGMVSAIYGIALLVGAGLYSYKITHHSSERKKEKEELRVEKDDMKTREELDSFVHTAPKEIAAEQHEIQETETIMSLIHALESRVNSEERIMPAVLRLLKQEHHAGLEKSGEGIPEAQEVISLCSEENHIIKKIWGLLADSKKLSQRIKRYTNHEEHKIEHDEAKEAAADREARFDHAESKEERHRLNKEAREVRDSVDELKDLVTDEKRIIHQIQIARRQFRKIENLNDDIIKLADARTKKEVVQEHIVKNVSETVHKKREILQNAIGAMKLIASYEQHALEDTADAARDAKKAESA